MNIDYPIRIYLDTENDTYNWVAEYPDLPGCIGVGDTKEEALSEAEANKSIWLESAEENGEKIPMPSIAYAMEYSGKFNLRIPKSLHRDLAIQAEVEGVSLNALCISLLSRGYSSLFIKKINIESSTNCTETIDDRSFHNDNWCSSNVKAQKIIPIRTAS
ncbi:MAG: toxin-antitoxin system HicB family antitoxin [Bacillota bacterium]|nr:toxin-antitoxin system HicB family antitoxin [Bacillota bacterium]